MTKKYAVDSAKQFNTESNLRPKVFTEIIRQRGSWKRFRNFELTSFHRQVVYCVFRRYNPFQRPRTFRD